MSDWAWFTRLHRAVYARTHGRIGARLAGLDVLLLTTRGRRSGAPRSVPLPWFADGDDLVVVASNNGGPRDPDWWLNLVAHPEAEIALRGERRRVRASLATPAERARLWPRLVASNPRYATYARRTSREIPVVILRARGD
jgi:deazaflavin-dependent oxidoreductase (nitroreductase family)